MFNRIVLKLIRAFFLVWHGLSGRGPRPVPPPESVRSVLLISTTGLGDTVISTPAVAAARRAWPEARLALMVHRRWASLLEACPHVDELVVYPGKFRRVFSLVRRLRSLKPDLVLILHANDPDIVPLAYLSGGRFLAGWATSRLAFLLDRKVEYPDKRRPFIERRLDVVRAAAGPLTGSGEELFIPEEKRKWAAEFWRGAGLADGERLVILNPGGSLQAKQWPAGHWRELIGRFAGAGCRTALFGSPAERVYLEELAGTAPGEPPVVVTRGEVLEAAALLERALVLIGPDSGLGHTAAALGVPMAILFGPDSPAASGPYLTRSPSVVLRAEASVCPELGRCKRKECRPNRCMEEITPAIVWSALERNLEISLDSGAEMQ